MQDNISPSERAVLLEEYKVIANMHEHFDNMNLSMMSTIIAGVFVLWGIMLTVSAPWVFVVTMEILVFLILSGWIRYMSIHRGIVVRKLTRAHEIEEMLDMRQNLIFRDDDKIKRKRHRPGAHSVEIWIFLFLVALGSVVTLCTCLGVTFEGEVPFSEILKITLSKLPCILVALAPLPLGAYWGIVCRVEVAQVIPFYRLPENRFLKWLLVRVGRYEDLYREIATSEREGQIG